MEYIGYIMIAMPFIVLFGAMWANDGLGIACKVSAFTFLTCLWIAVAIYLTDPSGVSAAFN